MCILGNFSSQYEQNWWREHIMDKYVAMETLTSTSGELKKLFYKNQKEIVRR